MVKILVIEDADPLRNDILEMLTFEGFEVLGAENGRVGVQAAREHHPDLIVCDIMMPELDGYGVLNMLRRDEATVAIPFIFLTAKTDRTDVRHGMGLGADDYLTKPFVASELLEAIQARLEKQKSLNELVDTRLKELSESIITALPHELRTPLNTIIGFSDMLILEAQHLKPEQVVDWSQHINLAALRLYRLVENYLLYVRTELALQNAVEVATLRKKALDQPNMVIEFHAVHKAQSAQRETDLTLKLSDESSVVISDQDLGKIVEEVLDNALKFSAPGMPVVLETEVADDQFILRISDQGRGMSAEQIDSIGVYMQFERWLYEQQGSGLGLVIVKRLSELYGGSLHIESSSDQGTTVTVRLCLTG
jgi:two-component system, sensor histidine kinase and response regulator